MDAPSGVLAASDATGAPTVTSRDVTGVLTPMPTGGSALSADAGAGAVQGENRSTTRSTTVVATHPASRTCAESTADATTSRPATVNSVTPAEDSEANVRWHAKAAAMHTVHRISARSQNGWRHGWAKCSVEHRQRVHRRWRVGSRSMDGGRAGAASGRGSAVIEQGARPVRGATSSRALTSGEKTTDTSLEKSSSPVSASTASPHRGDADERAPRSPVDCDGVVYIAGGRGGVDGGDDDGGGVGRRWGVDVTPEPLATEVIASSPSPTDDNSEKRERPERPGIWRDAICTATCATPPVRAVAAVASRSPAATAGVPVSATIGTAQARASARYR